MPRLCKLLAKSGLKASGRAAARDNAVLGLQKFAGGGVGWERPLLGINQPGLVLLLVEQVKWDPRGHGLTGPCLSYRREDAIALSRRGQMFDIKGHRDVGTVHVQRPDIDELAQMRRPCGLRINPARDSGIGRPDHDDDLCRIKRALNLLREWTARLKLLIPPGRANTVLLLQHGREFPRQLAVLG
jgi:hypothetical protein